MRDFSWQVFTKTGNVLAYLLYKESEATSVKEHEYSYSTFTNDQKGFDYTSHQVEDTHS